MSTDICTKDLTLCRICMETYTKPKALPCLHTFCLECLTKLPTVEIDGDLLPCPLCRRQFVIPQGGMDQLQANFLVEEIIQFRSLFASHVNASKDKCKIKCSFCEERESIIYCIECGADLCQSCSTGHTRLRATKNHRILTQEEKNNSKFIMKSRITSCEEHKDEALKLFCYD